MAAQALKKKPFAMVSSEASHVRSSICSGCRGTKGPLAAYTRASRPPSAAGCRGDEVRRPGGAAGVALHPVRRGRSRREQRRHLLVCRARVRARGGGHGGAVAGQVERERAPEPAHAAHHQDAGAGDLHAGSPRCAYSSAAISAMAASACALASYPRPFQKTTMTIGAPVGV